MGFKYLRISNFECGVVIAMVKSFCEPNTCCIRTSVADLEVWTGSGVIGMLTTESVSVTEIRNLWNKPAGDKILICPLNATFCTDWLIAKIWVRLKINHEIYLIFKVSISEFRNRKCTGRNHKERNHFVLGFMFETRKSRSYFKR